MERPGIKGKTFKIKFDENWINNKEYILNPNITETMTAKEILDKYSQVLTKAQIKQLQDYECIQR